MRIPRAHQPRKRPRLGAASTCSIHVPFDGVQDASRCTFRRPGLRVLAFRWQWWRRVSPIFTQLPLLSRHGTLFSFFLIYSNPEGPGKIKGGEGVQSAKYSAVDSCWPADGCSAVRRLRLLPSRGQTLRLDGLFVDTVHLEPGHCFVRSADLLELLLGNHIIHVFEPVRGALVRKL